MGPGAVPGGGEGQRHALPHRHGLTSGPRLGSDGRNPDVHRRRQPPPGRDLGSEDGVLPAREQVRQRTNWSGRLRDQVLAEHGGEPHGRPACSGGRPPCRPGCAAQEDNGSSRHQSSGGAHGSGEDVQGGRRFRVGGQGLLGLPVGPACPRRLPDVSGRRRRHRASRRRLREPPLRAERRAAGGVPAEVSRVGLRAPCDEARAALLRRPDKDRPLQPGTRGPGAPQTSFAWSVGDRDEQGQRRR
mmetsp:Transcript_32346/g.85407  ORF Transcript_32346/g.85407 Transcript_32346/m.85407 type:complete len:244 (+) Transcript_32346:248-979(+)